jgi:hypothetical protein
MIVLPSLSALMGEKTGFSLQLQQRCKVVVKIKPCVPFCGALQGCCAALDYDRAFATAESRRSMMPADIRAEKRVAMGVCLEDASGCIVVAA